LEGGSVLEFRAAMPSSSKEDGKQGWASAASKEDLRLSTGVGSDVEKRGSERGWENWAVKVYDSGIELAVGAAARLRPSRKLS
jgi:hypothetical protein